MGISKKRLFQNTYSVYACDAIITEACYETRTKIHVMYITRSPSGIAINQRVTKNTKKNQIFLTKLKKKKIIIITLIKIITAITIQPCTVNNLLYAIIIHGFGAI